MNGYINKLRLTYLKQCCELSPFIRLQDLEDTIYHKKHQLLKLIFEKKQHFKLLKHNKLLIYPVENDSLTEFRIDLDNQNLYTNIKIMFDIRRQLNLFNIKPMFEYTGNKGCHVRFLIDISTLNLVNKYSKVNLLDYEKEFRAKDKTQTNYSLINLIAKERLNLKKQIAEYLGLYKIIPKNDFDTNLLSSFYLIGSPGSLHRKSDKPKLDLDLELYDCPRRLLNYVKTNPQPRINFKFFSNVWVISKDFKFISEVIKPKVSKPQSNNKVIYSEIVASKHNKEDSILKAFKELYLNSNCKSINRFGLYVINVLHSFNFTLPQIKSLYLNLFDQLKLKDDYNNYSDDNINNKYDFIITNYNLALHSYNFKEFWTSDEFLQKIKEVSK